MELLSLHIIRILTRVPSVLNYVERFQSLITLMVSIVEGLFFIQSAVGVYCYWSNHFNYRDGQERTGIRCTMQQ